MAKEIRPKEVKVNRRKNQLMIFSEKLLEYEEKLREEQKKYPFLKHPAVQIVKAWREARGEVKKLTFQEFLEIERYYEKASPGEIEELLSKDESLWLTALRNDKKRKIYHALGACLAADAMDGLRQRKRLKSFSSGLSSPTRFSPTNKT